MSAEVFAAAVLLAAGCAHPAVAPRTSPAASAEQLCKQPAAALDEEGRSALRDLERTLVARTFSGITKARDDDWFNAEEINGLLQRYPATEMAFLFPLPVPMPATPFHVRSNATRTEIDRADHTVFYIEISDARVVRSGRDIGLVLRYGAGPTGKPPEGVVWLWGVWGQFCAVRGGDGDWSAHPMGPVTVSQRDRDKDRAADSASGTKTITIAD